MNTKLNLDFYLKDALVVAPELLGKILCRKISDGKILRARITQTEIYRGQEDTACHARFGKTNRSKIMYEQGGIAYVYMIYGLHFLLNVVTGKKNFPQAVLIRAAENFNGPAKLTKALQIDKNLNGESFTKNKVWIESYNYIVDYETAPRVGIDYADEFYKNIQWRFILKNNHLNKKS